MRTDNRDQEVIDQTGDTINRLQAARADQGRPFDGRKHWPMAPHAKGKQTGNFAF
jgi:hypothetical protein